MRSFTIAILVLLAASVAHAALYDPPLAQPHQQKAHRIHTDPIYHRQRPVQHYRSKAANHVT